MRRGFSLIEILVVVAIIGVLAALLYPQLKNYLERSKTAVCVSRLRGIGVTLMAYAGDHNMRVSFMRDGVTSQQWYGELKDQAGFTDEEAQKSFGCPSVPWQTVSGWRCYGFRLGTFPPIGEDPGKVVRFGGTGYYEFSMAAISEPSKFFVMSDSGTSSSDLQTMRIVPPGLYSGAGVRSRHQNRANALFLDGHVETLDSAGLGKLGFTKILDSDGQPTSTQH